MKNSDLLIRFRLNPNSRVVIKIRYDMLGTFVAGDQPPLFYQTVCLVTGTCSNHRAPVEPHSTLLLVRNHSHANYPFRVLPSKRNSDGISYSVLPNSPSRNDRIEVHSIHSFLDNHASKSTLIYLEISSAVIGIPSQIIVVSYQITDGVYCVLR